MTAFPTTLAMRPLLAACCLCAVTGASAQDAAAPAPAPDPAAEAPAPDPAQAKTHYSYGLGHRAGNDFSRQFGRFGVTMADIDREQFMKGFVDSFEGEGFAFSEEELGAAMQQLGDLLQKREQEMAAANLEAGQKFLEENKKREGVVTTDSGLQYEVLAKGGDQIYIAPKEGEPTPPKQFKVHYKGTLLDGTEFDSSPEGEPVTMSLQVVPGFREALTTMPVGAKWRLFLAPDLAYGPQRASAKIGPNSTLVFELELEAIEDAPAPQGLPFQLPGN